MPSVPAGVLVRDGHAAARRRGRAEPTHHFRPSANQFGIGHQIVVLSDGTLVDGFMLFHGSGRNKKGQEIAVMIS
ncbi:MAG: hypothetical protein ACRD0V_06660, partial [Acidimicrobiales bacterium]